MFVGRSLPRSTPRYTAQPVAATELSRGTSKAETRAGERRRRKPGIKRLRFLPWLPGFLSVLLFAEARAADCDLNGVDDAAAVETGRSEDCNANGVPDACDVVPLVFGTLGDVRVFAGEARFLSSADLDGDGASDLMVGTWQDAAGIESTLNIRFRPGPAEVPDEVALSMRHLVAVAAADVDGDGALDLVTLHGDVLQVRRNAGDAFESAVDVPTSAGTEHLVVADVDLDGAVDIITRNSSQGNVSWFRNLAAVGPAGEGGPAADGWGEERAFVVAAPARSSSLAPLFLEVADFDADGDVDVALAGGPDLLVTIVETTIEGNEKGGVSFSMAHSIPSAGLIKAFDVADLNGDGFSDLAASTTRRVTRLWRGNESGGFEEPSTLELEARALEFVDLDEDAFPDLLVRGPDGPGVSTFRLYQGGGDGTFRAPQSLAAGNVLFGGGDFDGDGDTDLAVTNAGGLTIFLQGERRGLVLEATRTPTWPYRPHYLDKGDLNGDGILDVVTANVVVFADVTDGWALYPGRGDGTFEGPVPRVVGGIVFAVLAVDLNEDGMDDLVFRGWPRGIAAESLFVLLNLGGGEFSEPELFGGAGRRRTDFLAKADVDGDGHIDVLSPDSTSDRLNVFFGDGRGRFGEPLILTVGRSPWAVAVGDLDADGDPDLVTANGLSSDVSLLYQGAAPQGQQQQTASFAPAVFVPVTGRPRGVALGDLDRDGDLDIVTATERQDDIAILLNRGDGVFAAVTHRFPIGRSPIAVILDDLDGDGFLDAITTDLNSSSVSVLRGRGDGTLSRPQHFGPANNARFTVSADFDRDGDVDLAVAHRGELSTPELFVLRNQGAALGSGRKLLETICTELDFAVVSVPDGSLQGAALSERRTKFLLPVREDPELLPTLFPNVVRFPLEWDFLKELYPQRFGALNEAGFGDLALRRATRELFAGAIRALRFEDGARGYGFDVSTEPAAPDELLSLDETRQVFTHLRESFLLEPLVYFPSTPQARAAARSWLAPGFPVVIAAEEEPPEPEPEAHPTFRLKIPADTLLCGVFAPAGVNHGAREEHELKTLVRWRAGTVTLPTETDTFGAELFEEVLFGPERALAVAQKGGSFRVGRVPATATTGGVATYRFTYSQPFLLPDGRLLELEIVTPFVFRARGEEPLEESQPLSEEFFVALKGREPFQAKLDGEPLVRYGSCTYDTLPLWRIQAELDDGTVLRLEERFEEAASVNDTGPASLVQAEVTLAGERRVVSDDFDLVYSASRHNTFVDYWVLLEPSIALDAPFLNNPGSVRVVELQAPESFARPHREASAAYLGGEFEVLARRAVTSFTRTPVGETLFLRGDAGGDGIMDVTDAIGVLRFLFGGAEEVACRKAADANDDGRINIVDPIVVLAVLFGRSGELPEPFPNCGGDLTEDALSCRSAPSCL
jgi:hypothetical protein